jgi:YesN/AraC family two-component response regulator
MQQIYDILISDVRMPTMDGYQLAWLVKKDKT